MITIFFDIGDTLVTGKNWKDGAEACVQALRQAARPFGVISNTGDLTRAQLTPLLPDSFDFALFRPELVVLSSEFREEKPHPAIFYHAIERAAVDPWNCVFVGENPRETWSAQSAGMRSIRISQFPEDFDVVLELTGTS